MLTKIYSLKSYFYIAGQIGYESIKVKNPKLIFYVLSKISRWAYSENVGSVSNFLGLSRSFFIHVKFDEIFQNSIENLKKKFYI